MKMDQDIANLKNYLFMPVILGGVAWILILIGPIILSI